VARLASLDFLNRLLAENGFAEQRIVRFGRHRLCRSWGRRVSPAGTVLSAVD
jgi:hypothetical protein